MVMLTLGGMATVATVLGALALIKFDGPPRFTVLKCDELQGYKFSRPIPAVLVLQYLATRLAAASALQPAFELVNVA